MDSERKQDKTKQSVESADSAGKRYSADEWVFVRQLGRRIGDLRSARGWTQKQFAEHVGISRQHQNFIETGRASLTVVVLRRIATALGCDASELLVGLGESTATDEKS